MSEFRQNLATQDWVILSPERGLRPRGIKDASETSEIALERYAEDCPFCPGNEKRFPNVETLRFEKDGTWSVRCIENKYKILDSENCSMSLMPFIKDGPYRKYRGCGSHELIVEHPAHNKTFSEMTDEEAAQVLEVFHQRMKAVKEKSSNQICLLFKNYGSKAGASQAHAHSQVVASRMVPLSLRYQIMEAQRHFDTEGVCVYCRMNQIETEAKERLVLENDSFVVYEPYASSVPYETWIIPKRCKASFLLSSQKERQDLGQILSETLYKLKVAADDPDYNLVINSAPFPMSEVPYFHWHLKIFPRMTTPGGFETGTGIGVNSLMPEEAAQTLRKIASRPV